MIKRIWRGWTTPENAEAYQDLLLNEVIPSIGAQMISGYLSTEVLREDLDREIEFSTVMSFESLESVIAFQGPDYARCYVPEAARDLLSRWDAVCRHYDVVALKVFAKSAD
ncbi:MAG: antibiotic biosynthesis monooxygenase [Henriciella sp.]